MTPRECAKQLAAAMPGRSNVLPIIRKGARVSIYAGLDPDGNELFATATVVCSWGTGDDATARVDLDEVGLTDVPWHLLRGTAGPPAR